MQLIRSASRRYAVPLAMAVAFAIAPLPAGAAPPASGAAAAAGIRIDNFGQVNDHYYRGAQPKGDDFRALSALGVKTLIDLAEEGDAREEANARAAGMSFVRIPMTTRQTPSAETIASFLALVNDPVNQPVYVHCIGGRHRTGLMTAIYRMTMDGWNTARAWNEVKAYKFGADFLHPEFKDFINGYVAVPVATAAAGAGRSPGQK